MSSDLEWRGVKEIDTQMVIYMQTCQGAARMVADYFAPIIEAYAKDHAPWTDQTANARQSLHTFIEELAERIVVLYLAHGVEYGRYLELAHGAQYAIILPALQAHYQKISEMLGAVFR